MLKLMGSIMIMLASVAMGASYIREQSHKLKTLEELRELLMCINAELGGHALSLPEILAAQASKARLETREFIFALCHGLNKLGEESFCDIWCKAVDEKMGNISSTGLGELKKLGQVLGRYELDIQLREVECCINFFETEIFAIRSTLPDSRRLGLGLSGSLGVLLLIMLL